MRWPWVSRALLDTAEREIDKLHAQLDLAVYRLGVAVEEQQATLAAERARYAELVAVLVEMKREGFQPPERPEQLEEVSGSLPDAVLAAIADRAAPKSDLERDLMKWAGPLVLAGGDPDKIARKILVGGDPQEEE